MGHRVVLIVLAAVTALLAACSSGAANVAAPNAVVTTHPSLSPSVVKAPVVAAVPSTPAPSTTAPAPNPCAKNTSAQLVRVSLHLQHLWMCAHHHLVHQSAITSGVVGQYTHTPTGNYDIQSLDTNTTLTLNTGQQFVVKYWIPFDAPLFGFHNSPWQHFPYGSDKYRTEGSHGCVHMPLKAIAYLYHWAHVGAAVHIRS